MFSPAFGLCLSVCLSVTTITKKIVDRFVPNLMGTFQGKKRRRSSCFVTLFIKFEFEFESVEGYGSNSQKTWRLLLRGFVLSQSTFRVVLLYF